MQQDMLSVPHSKELERAVLGAMLIDSGAIDRVRDVVRDETVFYYRPHRRVYRAICTLYDQNYPADQVTVTEYIAQQGWFDDKSGLAVVDIAEIAGEMATAANAEYHAMLIKEKQKRRQLLALATQVTQEAHDESLDVRELLDKAESRVFAIAQDASQQNTIAISDAIDDAFDRIEKAHPGELTGIVTGYGDFDHLTAGLQPSDLIIVASRPSMGKTALTLCMARNAAVSGKPVLYFSLEMSTSQLTYRLICAEARVRSHHLRTGRLTEDDWDRLANWTGKLAAAPLYINDTANISLLELRADARRAKSEYGIELIVVDYIQLMTSHERFGNREQEIAYISRSLKALAKDLDIPIIACAQLSRAVETRSDKRPQLSDLRESGSLEQDADVVVFLYRPEVYGILDDEGNTQEGVAELIVGKQRNGPIGSVYLTFVAEHLRFEEPAQYNEFQ